MKIVMKLVEYIKIYIAINLEKLKEVILMNAKKKGNIFLIFLFHSINQGELIFWMKTNKI